MTRYTLKQTYLLAKYDTYRLRKRTRGDGSSAAQPIVIDESPAEVADMDSETMTVEYFLIFLGYKEFTITSNSSATSRQLRKLAAATWKVNARGIRLGFNDRELVDDNIPLAFKGIGPKSAITCSLEMHECVICCNDVGYLDWPTIGITQDCSHKTATCKTCLRNWIGACLNRNDWDNIPCPEDSCREMLQYADVKRFASPKEFVR